MKKESIEKLQTVYGKLMKIDETTLAEMITEVIRAETLVTKVGKFNLYDYCGKEKGRELLHGVFHDVDGYKVATDGHILVAVKEDFPEDFVGKILLKDGSFSESNFPNWKCVIPKEDFPYECIVKENGFTEWLTQKKAEFKAEKMFASWWKTQCVVDVDGDICSAEYFMKFLTALKYIGAETFTHDQGKFFARTEKGMALCMGLYSAEDKEYIFKYD